MLRLHMFAGSDARREPRGAHRNYWHANVPQRERRLASTSDFRRSVRERRAARQNNGTRSRRIRPPRRRELRGEVFAHVERTGEGVAGTCTREDERYRISAAALGAVAAKFYLAAFDGALHLAHGKVALVRTADAAPVLLQEQDVLALAAEVFHVDIPASAEIHCRCS